MSVCVCDRREEGREDGGKEEGGADTALKAKTPRQCGEQRPHTSMWGKMYVCTTNISLMPVRPQKCTLVNLHI